jgi:hypothetical protein
MTCSPWGKFAERDIVALAVTTAHRASLLGRMQLLDMWLMAIDRTQLPLRAAP